MMGHNGGKYMDVVVITDTQEECIYKLNAWQVGT